MKEWARENPYYFYLLVLILGGIFLYQLPDVLSVDSVDDDERIITGQTEWIDLTEDGVSLKVKGDVRTFCSPSEEIIGELLRANEIENIENKRINVKNGEPIAVTFKGKTRDCNNITSILVLDSE